MGKFKDYSSLNGSSSRVTKKSKGTADAVHVMELASQPSGHFITNRKSDMREPVTARLKPRNLVSVMDSMTEDEKAMYMQICQLAGQ